MKKILRLLVLWFCLGVAYFMVELAWRLPKGQFPHSAMILVGGLCGVAVGAINQSPRFFNTPVWVQSLIGTGLTLAVELVSGLILNRWMGLGIWDYTGLPGNICGQICIQFAFAWLLIMPFAIWLEDRLRWGFGWNGKRYSLGSIYLEFVTLK